MKKRYKCALNYNFVYNIGIKLISSIRIMKLNIIIYFTNVFHSEEKLLKQRLDDQTRKASEIAQML